MRELVLIATVLSTGCVEYDLNSPSTRFIGPDTPGTWDTAPPAPPMDEIDECPNEAEVSIASGVYVLSWDRTEVSGVLEAQSQGWYHLYDFALSESGDSQRNESGYLRLPNDINPDGQPRWSNCQSNWVQVDQDNYQAPAATRVYLGTFWLNEGPNPFSFTHYCPLYRAGHCLGLHDAEDAKSTCESGNLNSVHFEGEGLCIVLADEP